MFLLLFFFPRISKHTVRQIINPHDLNKNENMEHAVDTVLPYLFLDHIFLLPHGIRTI